MTGSSGTSRALGDDALDRALRGAFLGGPTREPEPPLPQRVGPYRIVRRLGRGGMGVVYEAEESSPRRSVALKVLATGFDDPRAQQRFENECQVLASLQHPAIAQVYSAGTAPSPAGVSVPFFAMELVRGAAPLTRFAEDRALSVRQRIELFLQVLEGVRHGHERGVVHRDLKPANLLVDEAGRPKIIDFGISRATDAGLSLTPLHTRSGELLGTPQYMSPEQTVAGSAAIDARTDVYSLGVVLFELLARRLPYDVDGLGVLAVAQCVRERPALRLGAVDARLRGDLETIVGKALEKRPERRYRSVAALAADLRRYLASEPIAARPPSAAYQLLMFARRNKALVAGTLGVLAVSLAGTAVSSAYALRAEERTRELDREIYAQHLTVARAAVDAEDFDVAREQLALAAPARRGWEWSVLRRQVDRADLALRVPGEPGLEPACGFSDGGRTLLAWRHGGDVVHAFDVVTGEPRPALPVDGALLHGATDPERPRFFALHAGEVVAWDTARGERLWSVALPGGRGELELAPAGDRLGVVVKGALEIPWLDADTGRRAGATPVPMGLGSRSLARVDPLGRWIYVAGAVGTRFLDPRTGAQLGEVPASTSVAMDPDTGELWELPQVPRRARPLGGRPLVRRDPATLQPTLHVDPGAHRGGAEHVAVAPRSGLFACSYADGSVLVHDASNGAAVSVLDVMDGSPSLCWSPAGDVLAGVARDGDVQVWRNVAAPRPFELAVDGGIDGAVDAAGRRVVCGGWERASLWDARTGELLWSVPRRDSIRAASLRGELLAHGDKASGLTLLDASDGSPRWHRDVGQRTIATAIGPRSRRVFSGHPDGVVRAWDAATGEPVFARALHEGGGVPHLRVLEDGDAVASAGGDEVVLFDGRTGDVLRRLAVPGCRRVAWAPGGARIATSSGNRVEVWEVADGARVATLGSGGPLSCSDLAFLPDGSRCVTVDANGGVQVWDTGRWELLVRLRSRRSSAARSAHVLAVADDTLVVLGARSVSLLEAVPTAPETMRRRDALARARLLIDSLTGDAEPLTAELLGAIEGATRVDRTTRELACQQVVALGQNARELNEAAWLSCRFAEGTPEQAERAVVLAEAACAEEPERAIFLNTLGLARYRNRDHEGALDAFRRAMAIDEAAGRRPNLVDLAFTAAALHALGRADEARAAFARVRGNARYPDFGDEVETRRFVREVEATLAAPPRSQGRGVSLVR